MGGGATGMDNYAEAADLVRKRDRDRYLADLFAPAQPRRHLFALHAFAADVARIKDTVSDPTLGEIRLRWWRDAIVAGEGAGHPIAGALVDTMRAFALPAAAFEMLLEARIFDLYDDPMPTLDDLEGYAGETTSCLFQLSALVLDQGGDSSSTDAAGHGGVAEVVVDVLRALARNPGSAAKYVPDTLLDKHGLDRARLAAPTPDPAVIALLAELRAVARGHLDKARAVAALLPVAVRPAFLPLALVEARLTGLERRAERPFEPVEIAPWRRQWILWRAARRAK
jgi:phytoene synthase